MFNLTAEIAAWRKTILETETCTENDVNELQSHLNEEIDQLKTQSLTEKEAFMIAMDRIGRPQIVADEFAKVNKTLVFCNRIFWACSGVMAFLMISRITLFASGVTQLIARLANLDEFSMKSIVIISQITFFTTLATLCIILVKKGSTANTHKPIVNCRVSILAVASALALLPICGMAVPGFRAEFLPDSCGTYILLAKIEYICHIIAPILLAFIIIKFRPSNYGRSIHV